MFHLTLKSTFLPICFDSRAFRLLMVVLIAGLTGCSTMQATSIGFLKNQNMMTTSQDGSTAIYRSETPIDPHQVRSLSVEWFVPMDEEFSSTERTQLMTALEASIAKQAERLPSVVGGRPIAIRAVITRVEVVYPVLNIVTAVLSGMPLHRGGAAVEIEVLDAETLQPLASMAYAQFTPMSEFRVKFVRLAPAELALNTAAKKFAEILRGTCKDVSLASSINERLDHE